MQRSRLKIRRGNNNNEHYTKNCSNKVVVFEINLRFRGET